MCPHFLSNKDVCVTDACCPPGWTHFGCRCFIFYDIPKVFVDAQVLDGIKNALVQSKECWGCGGVTLGYIFFKSSGAERGAVDYCY